MKKLFLIATAVSLIACLSACQSNPYQATMQDIAAPNGYISNTNKLYKEVSQYVPESNTMLHQKIETEIKNNQVLQWEINAALGGK